MEADNTADDSSYWDRVSGQVIEATGGLMPPHRCLTDTKAENQHGR